MNIYEHKWKHEDDVENVYWYLLIDRSIVSLDMWTHLALMYHYMYVFSQQYFQISSQFHFHLSFQSLHGRDQILPLSYSFSIPTLPALDIQPDPPNSHAAKRSKELASLESSVKIK